MAEVTNWSRIEQKMERSGAGYKGSKQSGKSSGPEEGVYRQSMKILFGVAPLLRRHNKKAREERKFMLIVINQPPPGPVLSCSE